VRDVPRQKGDHPRSALADLLATSNLELALLNHEELLLVVMYVRRRPSPGLNDVLDDRKGAVGVFAGHLSEDLVAEQVPHLAVSGRQEHRLEERGLRGRLAGGRDRLGFRGGSGGSLAGRGATPGRGQAQQDGASPQLLIHCCPGMNGRSGADLGAAASRVRGSLRRADFCHFRGEHLEVRDQGVGRALAARGTVVDPGVFQQAASAARAKDRLIQGGVGG
jgi:hypothetical protein